MINHILRLHEQKIFDLAGYEPNRDGVLNSNNPAATKKRELYEEETRLHQAGFKEKKEKKKKIC